MSVPEGMCINHIDGVKNNNNINNLEVVTKGENNNHAGRTGLTSHGSRHCFAKLTNFQAVRIIERRIEGVSARELAEEHSVSIGTINNILAGRTWRRIRESVA